MIGTALGLALPVLGGIASSIQSKKAEKRAKQRESNSYNISKAQNELTELKSEKERYANFDSAAKLHNKNIENKENALNAKIQKLEKRNEYKNED